MKNVFAIVLILLCYSGWSQSIEVFAGGNSNHFFDTNYSGGHYNSSYDAGIGYSVGFALLRARPFYFSMRIAVEYKQYGGSLFIRNGGLAGYWITAAKTTKSVIALTVYPVEFDIKQKMHFYFGLEGSQLVNESFSGSESGWHMPNICWNEDITAQYEQLNTSNTFGLVGLISYDCQVGELLWLTPQYSFYLGLDSEFNGSLRQTKAFRNFIGIGLKKRLNLPKVVLP